MSTFKKVISLVLCVAMLAGSFVFVGDLAAPEASAAETTAGIDSYADLVAKYGQGDDGFIYVGTEFYEEDGRLTDYYVQPGDKLTVKQYIKSNMYTGEVKIMTLFDKTFFDAKIVANDAPTASTGYTSNCQTGVKNTDHPMIARNNPTHTLTSGAIPDVGWIKNVCGFSQDYLDKTDYVQSTTKSDINASTVAYELESDLWLLSYYVTVRSGLADGTKGIADSPDDLWPVMLTNKGKHDTNRQNNMKCLNKALATTVPTVTSGLKTMAAHLDSGDLDYFLNEDMYHEFTIGEPAEAVKYNVSFYEADGTTLIGEVGEYEEKEVAEFPEMIENQIGWAIIKDGNNTPGTLVEADADGNYSYTVEKKDAAFMRVLSTSTYNVEISLGNNVTVDESKLPENVTYDAEKKALVIALPIGGSFDLSTIPADALSTEGKTLSGWDLTGVAAPSTVEGTVITLGNTNGAASTAITAKVVAEWKTGVYKVRYFLTKEDYENEEAPVYETEIEYRASASYKLETSFEGMKFTGWHRADTDEIVNNGNVAVGSYTYSKDMDFYASWSPYVNTATFMIRDYENGEGWKEVYTHFNKNEPVDESKVTSNEISKDELTAIKDAAFAGAEVTLNALLDVNPDTLEDGDSTANHIVSQAHSGKFLQNIEYTGHKVYYIITAVDYTVTWKIPAFDEATGEFDSANCEENVEKVSTAAYLSNTLDPYYATSKLTKAITVPLGYELVGWIDEATGEPAELTADGRYKMSGLEARRASLIAQFDLIEYTVAFNIRNSDNPDIVTMVDTVTLGESIVIDGAKFTFKGEDSAIPAVGLENSEQADGGYTLPDGYKFAGWTCGYGAYLTEASFPFEITEDVIRNCYVNGAITFDGKWEAKDFTLTFYITNASGEEEVFKKYDAVKVGSNLAEYKKVTDEIRDAINAKAPAGQVFGGVWIDKSTGQSDTFTKMPARNMEYTASYVADSVKVYVDYNFLEEQDLSQTMKEFTTVTLIYGQDTAEIKSEDPYFERSFETVVKRTPISDINKPVEPAEIVDWNIYHVDSGDAFDPKNWEAGINDNGTTTATTTLIFQPVWVAHKDMLFRVYDTDDKIFLALGKNLKLYYWNSGNIVDSICDTQYNTNPELNVVLFFTIKIENWNWDEFFNIDMWSSLTIRYDAFPIPKSVFTIEGMIGIFEMLKNLIGSL
ncbi:MAG: hypothetical protein IJE74_01465 [Clostridia bacterium]|nr:hypothetical protein [Clostridia bacterium]